MRSEIGHRDESSVAAHESLWWPPSKIAGRYLAPYLARRAGGEGAGELEDIPLTSESEAAESDHREMVELALTAADANAGWRDHLAALRWLEVAEQLNLVLPPAYAAKRRRWTRAVTREHARRPGAART